MKPAEIRDWFARITKAENLQEERNGERKQILKLYVGELFGRPTDMSGENSEVNYVFRYVKTLIASIYARDPHIFVRAKSANRSKFAETMETVINYYWKELKLKKKIKQVILDSVLQPPGFIELGYLFLKEPKDDISKELEEEFPELKDPVKPIEKFGIFDETIKEDDVFANVLSSWDVTWPDGYHDIREAPYMFAKRKFPLIDIKSNPMFKSVKNQLNSSSFSGNTKDRTFEQGTSFTLKDDVQALNMTPKDNLDEENIEVTLYMVFDRRGQRRFILAKNFDIDSLMEKDWNYLPEGFPLFPLIFNEIPKTDEKANSYPLSDVVPMLPQLKELSLLSSAMMRHRKRSGGVIIAKKGEVTVDEITNIQEASDLDIIELENYNKDSMTSFTPPPLPNDFYRLREVIIEYLDRIAGLPQLLSAGGKGVETATESDNLRLGSQLIQSEKVDVIEDFTVDIAVYLSGLIWQFIQDKKRIAEIIGEDVDEEMWPSIPKDITEARKIIQKEIMFEIDAGSTRPPKDEAVERKQWQDLVATIEATYPGRLKPDVILKQLLKKHDFKDIDQAVIGFDEEEASVAEEENALLAQGIPVPVSPNQNHKIHLQVHAKKLQEGNSTKELEEHLLKHDQFEQQTSPTNLPQKGDSKILPLSTTPEARRKGVPENADFLGAVSQAGANKGR